MSVELINLANRRRAARAAVQEKKQKRNDYRDNLSQQHKINPVQLCSMGAAVCCDESWKRVEQERKTISNQKDVVERNRQINAAYADLYLNDPKDPKVQKWAATASLVSKQVGCTMKNNVVANNETLGIGNVAIFDNIYPTIKMYDLSQKAKPPMTEKELITCLERTVGSLKLEPLIKPIKLMFKGEGEKAAIKIADYEQKVIVQNAMWNSLWMKTQATGNMIIFGLAADQSVYFIADCSKPSNRELSFPYYRNLSYAETRVEYYIKKFIPKFNEINRNKAEMNSILTGIRDIGGTH